MKTRFGVALLALLAAPLAAQAPGNRPADYAWQWPLDTGSADGAVRLQLTPEVYARISASDLGDFAAFNASDEPIPLGPAALAFERLVLLPPPAPIEVPMFRVPREPAAADGAERIELHIARGADGRLTQLDAAVGADAAPASHDVLLDVSSFDIAVTGLRVELDALPAAGLNARVEVAASDDLAHWQTLATNLALVSLQDGALMLERRQLDLPATALPYLRLRRTDADAALPLRAVFALAARAPGTTEIAALPAAQRFTLQGKSDPADPGAFEYRSAGPFPVERAELELADRNSVAGFVLESRATADGAWIERARGTAFRLGSNGDGVDSAASELAQVRDRHWRVRTEPAQPRAPSLSLSYRPDQFVLLTQGPAPYRVVAGSRNARRPDYPLRLVLAEVRAQRGDLWLPPEATLGAGTPLAGDAALAAPPPPPPYKQWLLWVVLLGGALAVVAMVLKLMRTPAADRDAG